MNADNAFIQGNGGSLLGLTAREKREANIVGVPLNTQVFDRYAYSLNNPLKYIDPTGHITHGDDEVGYTEDLESGIVIFWFYDTRMAFNLNDPLPENIRAKIEDLKDLIEDYEDEKKAIMWGDKLYNVAFAGMLVEGAVAGWGLAACAFTGVSCVVAAGGGVALLVTAGGIWLGSEHLAAMNADHTDTINETYEDSLSIR